MITLHSYELEQLILAPTAGLLRRGESEINAKLYKDNGLLVGTKVGLFPRFMFGINYGAERIVGNQDPIWHERVEFNAKYRLFDESPQMPAFVIGFNSQGHGKYYPEQSRYDIKSKGFYGVASKNWSFLGNLGLHLGVNYSLENKKDDNIGIFAGADKNIGEVITFLGEYDLGINDNENWLENETSENLDILGHGYLNLALKVNFTEYLFLKISMFDLLKNRSDTQGCDRALTLVYLMTFQ